MTIECNPEYLAKVSQLSEEEAERLLSRMTGKLPRRLEKNKLTNEEALAIQLELEDEQLQEWREKMQSMRERENTRKAAKSKVIDKEEASSEPKPLKKKATSKQLLATKDKVSSKTKTKSKAAGKTDQNK